MVDGCKIKAYKLPPVVTTVSMRKRDDEEINDDEGMVQSDPPPTQSMGSTEMGVGVLFVHSIPRETHILKTVNAGAAEFISSVGRQH